MLSALNKAITALENIPAYLETNFKLNTIDYKEATQLCLTCKEYYHLELPASQDLIRLTLKKLNKCNDILTAIIKDSGRNKGNVGFISNYRDNLKVAILNVSRNARQIKFDDINIFILSDDRNSSEGVHAQPVKDIDPPIAKTPQTYPLHQQIGWDHPRVWDYIPNDFEYEE